LTEEEKVTSESVEISEAVDASMKATGCADWLFVGVGIGGSSVMNFSMGNGRKDSEVSNFHRIQRVLGLLGVAKHELIRKLIEEDEIFKGV